MRLLTALLIIGLSAFAVIDGWRIVSFTRLRAEVADGATSPEALRRWVGVPGLGGMAVRAALSPMRGPADLEASRRRAEDLAALLARHPLSGADWLALAGMRLVSGKPTHEVVAALAMSSLTAPNEGLIMAQRGVFGLLQWEVLPGDARQQAASDLAGAILPMPSGTSDAEIIKTIVAAKSAATRSQIANVLGAAGVSPDGLARIGL